MEVFTKDLKNIYKKQITKDRCVILNLNLLKNALYKQGYELASSYARMPAGRTDKIAWTNSCTTKNLI